MAFMLKLSAEVLEEAFIQPIRFAMLLDDQFPVYKDFAGGGVSTYDFARATSLFNLCRDRGWLCDVDNRAKIAANFDNDKHLHQSDLLILDFHLDQTNSSDPSEALRILQKLSHSHHFNLVLVYTSEEANSVIRDIAYCLGAGLIREDQSTQASAALTGLSDETIDDLKELINSTILTKFLSGNSFMDEAKVMRSALEGEGVPARLHLPIISKLCSEFFEDRVAPDVAKARPKNAKVVGDYKDNSDVKWLVCENVFVAVANKRETDPKDILDNLKAGLAAWNPTVLQVMMIHARSALEKIGNLSDAAVLSDPARQAGWLLPILLAESSTEKTNEVVELYRRLFNRLIDEISPTMVDLGGRLVAAGEFHPVEASKFLAQSTSLSDKDVYHALNEHLCSEAHKDGYMSTGLIFRDEASKEFWLCSTPACDLVPGRKTGRGLDPWLPISAVKLTPIKNHAAIVENLQNAEIGNHIFVRDDGKPIVLEALEPQSRQMVIETLVLKDEGVIVGNRFSGCRSEISDGIPTWKDRNFIVIGRLRTAYADRLLAFSGNQRARIGVDFVNMPTPFAEKA